MINFKDKKFLIMGLGYWGGQIGAIKFLAKNGAKIIVTDIKNENKLRPSLEKLKNIKNIKFHLGTHRVDDFINADCIIKSAGIPDSNKYLELAKKHKIPIKTDISLFFELSPTKNIIGITGTKGKSTTSFILYQIIKKATKNVFLGGNIGGGSILEKLDQMNKNSIVILELSSWQLESIDYLKISPKFALITNIFPEHLNYYKNFKKYIEAKKIIFKYQEKNDTLVLNYDNDILKEFKNEAKSKVYFYSTKHNFPELNSYIKDKKIFFEKEEILNLEKIKIKGEHNISNILGAITLAKILNIGTRTIKDFLYKFDKEYILEGRIEFVGEVSGIKFYNDSSSTNPISTINAINTLKNNHNIILIAGGVDKNLNYKELAEKILKDTKALILFTGSASKKILNEIDFLKNTLSIENKLPIFKEVKSMQEAIKIALTVAKNGDIVLLSPASASFNLFLNEAERGDLFKKEVQKLSAK